MTTVYKAIRIESGRLVSWAAYSEAARTYGIGRVTRPPVYLRKMGYGLLAFLHFKDAKHFLLTHHLGINYSTLFEAEATGVRTENLPPVLSSRCDGYMTHGMRAFENGLVSLCPFWPDGTIMCDSIELIKEIPWTDSPLRQEHKS